MVEEEEYLEDLERIDEALLGRGVKGIQRDARRRRIVDEHQGIRLASILGLEFGPK